MVHRAALRLSACKPIKVQRLHGRRSASLPDLRARLATTSVPGQQPDLR